METDLERRGMLALFSGMAALALTGGTAAAQGTAPLDTTEELSRSRVIKYASLKAIDLPNGGTQRRVMSGTLPTGEYVEIHESMLPAGKMPHAPHKHNNSEWLFIQAGTLEYLDDGKAVAVGPGDIVFSASYRTHGLRNVGATPATYIVFSVSKQDVPL